MTHIIISVLSPVVKVWIYTQNPLGECKRKTSFDCLYSRKQEINIRILCLSHKLIWHCWWRRSTASCCANASARYINGVSELQFYSGSVIFTCWLYSCQNSLFLWRLKFTFSNISLFVCHFSFNNTFFSRATADSNQWNLCHLYTLIKCQLKAHL